MYVKGSVQKEFSKTSEWVEKYIQFIPRSHDVLDLACGQGRHVQLLLARGFSVVALDKDISKLDNIPSSHNLRKLEFDLEKGKNLPLPELFFSGVIVTNYLHRPLFQDLPKLLESGGVLIYQTFMRGNEAYGRPKRRDYLLERNELFEVFELQFDVLAFEQGYTSCPRPAIIQSICARKRQ